MLRILAWTMCLATAAATVVAQDKIAFDVASIKPASVKKSDPHLGIGGLVTAGGRWSAKEATVVQIIANLYGLRPEQVAGAPTWASNDLFVINAKAADASASADQLKEMAKQLLVDRFGLRIHVEQRPFNVHEMVLVHKDGTLGPSLRRTNCVMRSKETRILPSSQPVCGAFRYNVVDGVFQENWAGVSLRTLLLARRVEQLLGTPVVDKTGLNGMFDIQVEYVPESQSGERATGVVGPSLFSAMETQLGLAFERRQGILDVAVIDAIQHPTPD
jgi:uncharacterized protein (TIGR03435 family)